MKARAETSFMGYSPEPSLEGGTGCGHVGSSSVVERFREIRVLRLWLQTSFLESARNARYALVRTRIRWPQRKLRPLEPGHFLTDPAAPRRGKLPDVGSGLSRSLGGQGGPSFQELLQMEEEPTSTKVESQPTMSQWMMQILRRVKYATCTPAAAAVYPYIRANGREGIYLYCLARRKD